MVCALTECSHNGQHSDLFEERFFVVEAYDEQDAKGRVELEIGEDLEYEGGTGNQVTWRSRGVVEVLPFYPFGEEPVAELTSRFFHDIESYTNFIKSREEPDDVDGE